MWNKDIEKVLISEAELDKVVSRLADEINRDYRDSDKRVVLLCILKGSIIFMSDLMKTYEKTQVLLTLLLQVSRMNFQSPSKRDICLQREEKSRKFLQMLPLSAGMSL